MTSTDDDRTDDRPRVVISDTKLTTLATEREVFGDEVTLVHDPLRSPDAVADSAPDAIVVDASTPMTAAAFEACSRLRVVVRAGVGVDNIDLAAAAAADVTVSNVPDYSVDEVSAHATALCVSLARGIPTADADTTAGRWDWEVSAPLYRPERLAVGVVGCGRIGSRTARKVRDQFGRVLVHDPYVADDEIRSLDADPVGFETLLRESDVITIHTPLTPETRGLFDAAAFDTMREAAPPADEPGPSDAGPQGTILVNTARGAVVNREALVDALADGTVRSAGLDVLPAEPPPDDRLTGRGDVVVTPHVAWYSEASKREVRRKAAAEARRVLRGEAPQYEVSPDAHAGDSE